MLLVIEVADTTIGTDREVKRLLYAGENIPEYWIVNLEEDVLEVYRRPDAGDYQDTTVLTAGHELELVSLPGVRVNVSEILDPPPGDA